ncbi:MAG: glutathione S-transferase N-terminal domain-containing protein, partial [Gammaproteobacteria bacterium]
MSRLAVHHIPVCPFCQRLEIQLALMDRRDAVDFHVVDITRPRPEVLLALTRGSTALPILVTEDGRVIKESLVIMQYLDDRFAERRLAQRDPYRHAVEGMLTRM